MTGFFRRTKIIAMVSVFFSLASAFSQNKQRTVKVGYFYGEGFQEISPIDGRRFGYGYDYLQNVAYFAGWKYQYIDTNWDDAIRMFETGEIDILTEVSKTDERKKYMYFADHPMGAEDYYIFILPDSSKIKVGSLESIENKKIGINAGTYQLEVFRQWVAENNIHCEIIEYYDEMKRNDDLMKGKLDAAVDYDFYLDKGWIPIAKVGSSNYYIAVSKQKQEILNELNAAQEKLFESTPLFVDQLRTEHFPHEIISRHLNVREVAWLTKYQEKHGKIKIGYTNNYLPYCAKNKTTGELEGALTVFVNSLKDIFGIEVETVSYDDRDELYEAVRNDEIPACFPLYTALWQAEELGVMQTEAVIDFPTAFIFRSDEYNGVEKMKRIAVSETSQLHTSYIRDKFPEVGISFYKDYATAIKAVSTGKVDGMFINTFILARLSDDYQQFKNLDLIFMQNDAKLSIGVSFSNPELLSIFNKTALLLDTAVNTSSLIRNANIARSYSLRRFLREYSVAIIIFILLFSAMVIIFMKKQVVRINIAKQQADSAKQDAESLNIELEAALTREKQSQAAVQQAFEAANRANAAKTEFLASMSHDIRTPMNAIIGMTAIAAANLDDKEKIQHCLSEITVSSKHLLGLINEVLDMNKIESGKVSLNISSFNLANVVDDFVAVSKPLIKEKRHDFIVNVHDIKHENVIGDPGRIQQCLMNFMSNAVKYTPEGGKIRVSITEKFLPHSKVGCYEFIFEDNGIGMSEEFIPKLFDPFARAEDSRAQKQQGTGLGMSITRNIINMMNGDIKVESKLNEGTKITATIFLEICDSDENIAIEDLLDLPVLVADDDKIACETTCFVLNDLGMKGEWVLSGKEAVEKVVEHHENENDYFAAIIDWQMPGMDGVETTRQIRAKVGNGVPIIIISAYDWTDIEAEAREAGANAFIAKPIFKSKVAHTFMELTGRRKTDIEQAVLNKYRDVKFTDKKVLLVEDNEMNSEIATEILEMTGISVEVAWNGKEAVEKLEAVPDGYYSAVFMDIQMPIMNGYEATEAIRKSDREYLRRVPIVAMSANAFAEDVQKALSVGMNDHVAKPLDFNILLSTLHKILG